MGDFSMVPGVPAEPGKRAPVRGSRGAPGVVVAIIGVACGVSPLLGGFYSFSVWGVIALGMLALAWGLIMATEPVPRRLSLVALAGLVALACISVLSLSWAESADRALVNADRWILYAATFAVLILAMRTDGIARLGIAAATAGIVVVASYVVARMIGGDGPSLFLGGRLNEPLGYVNSQGLFFVLGIWPLVALAQYARPVAAALGAAGATALGALAVLSQSRSVALAFLVSGLVVMVLVPGRQRRAWVLLVVLGGVVAIGDPLLDVYQLGQNGKPGFEGAIHSAGGWTLLAAGVVGLAWGLIVAADRRMATPALRRASGVALATLALVAAGVVAANAETIANGVRDQARAFTTLHATTGRTRFLSGGGYRYDFWRIAVHEFAHHPLGGVGAGNYTREYFLLRRTTEDVRQPHSIELQALSELGLIGLVGLGFFVVAVAAGGIRRLQARSPALPDQWLLVACLGGFAAWLTNASVDWSHLFPGVTGAALLVAAWLVRAPNADHRPSAGRPGRRARLAAQATITLAVAAAAILIARPLLAEHYLTQGQHALRSDPVRAIDKANDSLAFNGQSVDALYLKAAAFARLDDYGRSRGALLRATRLEPHNFVSWSLLADLAVRRGRLGVARRYYERAWRLNPQDPMLATLRHHPRP